MSKTTTGQLDQMIELKINQKINDFSENITNQIMKFLQENGEYSPTRIEVADGWEREGHYDTKTPKAFTSVYSSDFKKSLSAGIARSVKQQMVAQATKELLDKVSLLS
jgi:hypothetical protein